MRCFEDGLRDEFFRLYERYMPEQYRVVDLDARKVEFWLQIYFAVFPALPSSAGKRGARIAEGIGAPRAPGAALASGMAKLRKFIETRGRDVAGTEELLPFYALPYVPQPMHHPTFKSLFEPRWTTRLRAMVEAFLANAPDEMPAPRLITILRHYYGLVDAATNDSTEAKLSLGRDDALIAGGSVPSRAGGGYGIRRDDSVGDGPITGGAAVGAAGANLSSAGPPPSNMLRSSQQLPPRPVSVDSASGGGHYAMLGSPGAGVRGVTPLLEGSASLRDFVPTPDLSEMAGDDHYNELDSLAAHIAALDPENRPKSAAKPPKSPAPAAKHASESATEGEADGGGDAHAARSELPTVDVSSMSRAMSAEVTSRGDSADAGTRTGLEAEAVEMSTSGRQGEYSFDDLLSNNEGLPVIAAPTVHYMSGGGLETHRGGQKSNGGRRIMTPYADVIFAPLDYDKVRLDLRADVSAAAGAAANNRAARLLQSLRWRMTRSSPMPCRDAAQTLVDGDVLALCLSDAEGTENTPSSLVDVLINCGGRVREECLRLINALASYGPGRRYLLSPGSRVVAALSANASPDEPDTPSRRHLLGALQKLSLHRRAARRMVALGLLPWIAKVLLCATTSDAVRLSRADPVKTLSEYDAEVGAALLMNMSLLPQGKRAAESMLKTQDDSAADVGGEDILEVLSLLLQSPSSQVRTYANGTLYSLLQRETIRASALSRGFEDLLVDLAAHSDPVFVRQLTYIISLLRSTGPGTAPEPVGGAPDDDLATPFAGYARFDPETFDDVDDAEGGELQEEEAITASEERAGSPAARPSGGGDAVLFGEELLRAEFVGGDDGFLGGLDDTINGAGFGRETIGPDDDAEDFLPKEIGNEEGAAGTEAKVVAAAPTETVAAPKPPAEGGDKSNPPVG